MATLLPRPNPLRAGIRALLEAKQLASLGKHDDAIAALEAAYAAGCRYKKEWLTSDRDLAPLATIPAFGDLVSRANARYE
ncbi:MAG TPA: hypothetical protein VFV20_00680, partial [Candidatus Limnocylindria bacterium]|nr:hypothetical protein [Candidatus Limnocylindria bacterium]